MSDTYFFTQSAALMYTEEETLKAGYDIIYPNHLWAEHVNYGTSVKYDFPLVLRRTGNAAKKWLHIQLYRMGNGKYELSFYLA
jgi:hypothetical protein